MTSVPTTGHRARVVGKDRRLRRHQRRLAALLTITVLGLTAVAIMGQARPGTGTIEAQRFVVKDGRGRPRAVLGALGDVSALNVYDKDGRARAALQVTGDGGSRLAFYDREGKSRMLLDVAPDGTTSVGFFGKDQRARAELLVSADGTPSVGFFDREGRAVWPGRLLLP